jgi:hypothetical protein
MQQLVMSGLVPGIHVLAVWQQKKTWMAGTPSAKTRFALLPGHDGEIHHLSGFFPTSASASF